MDRLPKDEEPILLELVSTSVKKKNRFPAKALAVSIGGLTLLAGVVKAQGSEGSYDRYSLAVEGTAADTQPTDTLISVTSTTTLDFIDTTTTTATSTDLTVDSTMPADPNNPYQPDTPSNPDTTSTTVDSTIGPNPPFVTSTLPVDSNTTTTYSMGTPDTTPQDLYTEICLPMGWQSCAVYEIYRLDGSLKNTVIMNSDWSLEYIASVSGGAEGDYALKIRDIFPL